MYQVEPFLISDAEFETFLERHKTVKTLVPESNTTMRNSYLILDEYMRFLDNTGGSKMPSKRYSNSHMYLHLHTKNLSTYIGWLQ